jgi:precorrin-6B methylase 2
MVAAEKIIYRVDTETGVLIREGTDPNSFGYRDTSEEGLIELFKTARDLSSGSAELRAAIKDWPTEYHLSIARTNLLRGFDLTHFSSVLEIGCGCGAITRQLGEQVVSVTALDGSLTRATATRIRCRDLANVEVVSDNFQSYEDHRRYDLVTLIGVLEYAPMFISGDKPFEQMLLRAKSFLKPGGVLLIAIENLLGLKYFAGHEEDHVGKSYWGIQGLYQPQAAKTLGRVEMDALLRSVGFHSNSYFYPFPDYKLPRAILSEEGVRHPGFKPADILAAHDARSYNGGVNLPFDAALVWDSLAANQLLPHMANSFLIWSGAEENGEEGAAHRQPRWLAKNFSISEVSERVCTTSFIAKSDNSITVSKVHEPFSGVKTSFPVHEERYVTGENLLFVIRRALAARLSLEEIRAALKPWLTLLMENRVAVAGGWTDWKLSKEFFDCVPHNIILSDGKPSFIDREASPIAGERIEFSWVVIRGLLLTLCKSSDYGVFQGLSARQAVQQLCSAFGFSDFEVALPRALDCERLVVLGPQAPTEQPFYLQSFSGSVLTNRVDHFRKLWEESEQVGATYRQERDQALGLLSQRIATISDLQLSLDELRRLCGQKEAELVDLRKLVDGKIIPRAVRYVWRRLRGKPGEN